MKQDLHQASRREFPRRMATPAAACSRMGLAADRRKGSDRRRGANWVARAIAAAERRVSRKPTAASPYKKEG